MMPYNQLEIETETFLEFWALFERRQESSASLTLCPSLFNFPAKEHLIKPGASRNFLAHPFIYQHHTASSLINDVISVSRARANLSHLLC